MRSGLIVPILWRHGSKVFPYASTVFRGFLIGIRWLWKHGGKYLCFRTHTHTHKKCGKCLHASTGNGRYRVCKDLGPKKCGGIMLPLCLHMENASTTTRFGGVAA
jgi:hypothetical protein